MPSRYAIHREIVFHIVFAFAFSRRLIIYLYIRIIFRSCLHLTFYRFMKQLVACHSYFVFQLFYSAMLVIFLVVNDRREHAARELGCCALDIEKAIEIHSFCNDSPSRYKTIVNLKHSILQLFSIFQSSNVNLHKK